jgi:hypothetical protein
MIRRSGPPFLLPIRLVVSVADLNSARPPIAIECLACGAVRIVYGVALGQTGECQHCRYLGWTYSDDLDGSTRRLILNGGLAHPPGSRGKPGGLRPV